jgi:hypothetical protein
MSLRKMNRNKTFPTADRAIIITNTNTNSFRKVNKNRNDKKVKFVYHKFNLLLYQLKHFISTIEHYTMNRILNNVWTNLCNQLLTCNNFNEMIQSHQIYINKINDRFLLRKAKFVMNHILKVIELCLNLRIKFNEFQLFNNEENDYDDKSKKMVEEEQEEQDKNINEFLSVIQGIEIKFQKSIKMLLSILESILRRGKDEHLEDLKIRLNFNNFYT